VAMADVNGDGNADIATANFTGNDATLLFGNGDGTLQTPGNIPLTSSNTLQNVIVGDLNNDSIPDLVVANNTGSASNTKITIFQGRGTGQYAPGVVISPGGNIQNLVGLAIGHFSNANGSSASFPDIAFLDGNHNTVGFLQNKIRRTITQISAVNGAVTVT